MSSYFIYGFTRIATKSNLIFTANQPVTLNHQPDLLNKHTTISIFGFKFLLSFKCVDGAGGKVEDDLWTCHSQNEQNW